MSTKETKSHLWQITVVITLTLGIITACSQANSSPSAAQQAQQWSVTWSSSTRSDLNSNMLMGNLKVADPSGQLHMPSQITILFNGSLDALAFIQMNSYIGLAHMHRNSVTDMWNLDGAIRDGSQSGMVTNQLQGVSSLSISFHVPSANYSGSAFEQSYGAPYVMQLWNSSQATLTASKLSTLGIFNTTGLTKATIQEKSAWEGITGNFTFFIVPLQNDNYYIFGGTLPESTIQSLTTSTVTQLQSAS